MILCAHSNERHSSPLFETLLVSVGMGGNWDYFSGIDGNWTIV